MTRRDRRHLVVSIVALYRDAVIRTPGGRELLEEKKRQLKLAGVLDGQKEEPGESAPSPSREPGKIIPLIRETVK